jgi:hypothetical protein
MHTSKKKLLKYMKRLALFITSPKGQTANKIDG